MIWLHLILTLQAQVAIARLLDNSDISPLLEVLKTFAQSRGDCDVIIGEAQVTDGKLIIGLFHGVIKIHFRVFHVAYSLQAAKQSGSYRVYSGP
jgi:hypothetical protein